MDHKVLVNINDLKLKMNQNSIRHPFKFKNRQQNEGEYADAAYAFMALVKSVDYIKLIGTKIYFNAVPKKSCDIICC